MFETELVSRHGPFVQWFECEEVVEQLSMAYMELVGPHFDYWTIVVMKLGQLLPQSSVLNRVISELVQSRHSAAMTFGLGCWKRGWKKSR